MDDTFRLDNSELFTIRIVGHIEDIAEHATNHTYQISDGTGLIECKLWVEKNTERASRNRLHDLVRVTGTLREYEGRRHILVYDIARVNDWNEMTHHFLGLLNCL